MRQSIGRVLSRDRSFVRLTFPGSQPQSGLVVRGHGSGEKDCNSNAESYSGTKLVWCGARRFTGPRVFGPGRLFVALLLLLTVSVRPGFACTATAGTCSVNGDCCSRLCVAGICVASDRNIVYAEDYATCATPPCGLAGNPWTSVVPRK